MAVEPNAARQMGLTRHLAGLLLASVACVAVLAISLAANSGASGWSLQPRTLVIIAVIAGAFAFMSVAVALLLRAVRAARRFERDDR